MEEREIAYIGEDLYQRTIADKKNGKWTKHDIKLEAELYKELNALKLEKPFFFYWDMQLGPTRFTKKDKGIVPIFKKCIGKFDSEGLNYLPLYCLGVPGLYEATEILLAEYDKYVGKSGFILNVIVNSLYRVCDPRYTKVYMDILNDEKNFTIETVFFLGILGKLKCYDALDRIIEFLDYVYVLPSGEKSTAFQAWSIVALGKFKNPEHIKLIEKFLDKEQYPYSVFQENAVKAIKKMGGHVEKIKDAKGKSKWILIND